MSSLFFIALRMLTGDRPKFIGLVSGLTFATFLMAQQLGIFSGFMRMTGVWVREVGADVWVVDPETEMVDDLKQMRNGELQRVRSIEGVQWAVPMYKNYAQARLPDGSSYLIRLVGLDDATLYGGPPGMVEGDKTALRQDQAVFVDGHLPEGELLMKKAKPPLAVRQIGMGDRLDINDHVCRVVGRYEKTREFFWGTVVYTTFSRAQAVMPQTRKNTTFILVKAAPGTSPEDLAKRIRHATRLGAFTTPQMEWKTIVFVLTKTGILVTFGTTATLGCLIGMLICAQLFWSFVHDNVRYFGMMKAIGATERMMAFMVAAQAGTVAFIGLGLGLGLACLLALATAGKLAFHLDGLTVAAILTGVFFCTAVAGLASFLRIRKIEPGIVFR
jgi:putative ABC transport system permease protein